MPHCLEISKLNKEQITAIIHRALEFKRTRHYPSYPEHSVANLFYEHSTRTRVSFELAAKNLNMKVINIALEHSSEAKGEVLEDTIRTLAAMGIHYFVIRHQQEGVQAALANKIKNIHIVNAGDGTHAHPSQALLDMMTIMEQKPAITDLKIALVGNIKHSRVARSFQAICQHFKVKDLVLIAPPIWQPDEVLYGRSMTLLQEGLSDADVVMCLRVQKERLLEHEHFDFTAFRREFALTKASLAYAKKDVMVMHPGPMNRGVELDSDVADGAHSFILRQVENGVFVRMAILEFLQGSG